MFKKWLRGTDSPSNKMPSNEAFEARLVKHLYSHPYALVPGFLMSYDEESLKDLINSAKENLVTDNVSRIYEEGLGDRFLYSLMGSERYAKPLNQEELVARARNLRDNYGINENLFRLWLNLSPLEREARRMQSQLPIIEEIRYLMQQGLQQSQAISQVREGSHTFVWYSDSVEAINRRDVDAPLHMELFPVINEALEFIGSAEENNTALMMMQECREYPSANAWIRHRILKIIDEDDIENDHPGSYIRLE